MSACSCYQVDVFVSCMLGSGSDKFSVFAAALQVLLIWCLAGVLLVCAGQSGCVLTNESRDAPVWLQCSLYVVALTCPDL